MRKQIFKNVLLSFLIGIIIAALIPFANVKADSLPKISDPANYEKMLTILKKCDKHAYKVVQNQSEYGKMFCKMAKGETIAESIDTLVHESYHGYVYEKGMEKSLEKRIETGFKKRFDYICLDLGGGEKYYLKKYDNFFQTSKATKSIPKKYRTFRYETYVSAGETTSANTSGIQGLMDEYCTYYYGCKTMVALKKYYKNDPDYLENYAVSLANNMTARNEFKFWILHYLLYAKKNKPEVYKEIINDKAYCKAYASIERKCDALYKKELADLSKLGGANGTIRYHDKELYYMSDDENRGVDMGDYELLNAVLKKSEYAKMDKLLKAKAK